MSGPRRGDSGIPRRVDGISIPGYYADTGCDLHPKCLTCPLSRCVYDRPEQAPHAGATPMFARHVAQPDYATACRRCGGYLVADIDVRNEIDRVCLNCGRSATTAAVEMITRTHA